MAKGLLHLISTFNCKVMYSINIDMSWQYINYLVNRNTEQNFDIFDGFQ